MSEDRTPTTTDTSTDDGVWMIVYEDRDVPPEIFSGYGAQAGALATFEQALINWNCHLFERVSDGNPGCAFRALAAERDAAVDVRRSTFEGLKIAIRDAATIERERNAAIARAEAAEADRAALVEVARAAQIGRALGWLARDEKPLTDALDALRPGMLDHPSEG